MGGDVWQWNEAVMHNDYRDRRGGAFYYAASLVSSAGDAYAVPYWSDYDFGFRVAAETVPEPGGIALLVAASLGLAGVAVVRWRRRAKR